MSGPYDDIREVVNTNRRKTNLYLQHGYRLLAINLESGHQRVGGGFRRSRFTPGKRVEQPPVVSEHRYVLFTLGRPEGVPHYDPTHRPPPAGAPPPPADASTQRAARRFFAPVSKGPA